MINRRGLLVVFLYIGAMVCVLHQAMEYAGQHHAATVAEQTR